MPVYEEPLRAFRSITQGWLSAAIDCCLRTCFSETRKALKDLSMEVPLERLNAEDLFMEFSRSAGDDQTAHRPSDELDYEVGSSESSRGSSSVTARFVTIEASPEFAWNDDPQPVRLATRRADLCATVEDADDEDESEPPETIKGSLQLADAPTLESVAQGPRVHSGL
ncbi:hypothetical protein E4U60_005181 [Claviceps pazoutovae]|uniref:Uncharacterized protein n=1 Tax=Claviceps pazoutovae TaxID=1649127 RepID=A0A9P7SEB8_9HYPO|nr:hypothetical protein E4U60_005181 [Claviceps pazoutovae]